MKRLFTLISALLLCQSMVVAQNFLHVYSGDTRLAEVPTAELDSVTVRDKLFYGYEWEYSTTCTYISALFGQNDVGLSVYKRPSIGSDKVVQYKVQPWLFNYCPTGLVIDVNTETNECNIGVQATGYIYNPYGMMYVVTSTENPSTFDPSTGLFTLNLWYLVEYNGGLAVLFDVTESIQLDMQSRASARKEAAQPVRLELKQSPKLDRLPNSFIAPRRTAHPKAESAVENTNMQLQPMTTREINEQ